MDGSSGRYGPTPDSIPTPSLVPHTPHTDIVRKQHLEAVEPPVPSPQAAAAAAASAAGSGAAQPGQPPAAAPPPEGGHHHHNRAELRRALLQSLGLPPDARGAGALHQAEELMLMEAIRQSIREHAAAAAAAGVGAGGGRGGGGGEGAGGLGEEGKEEEEGDGDGASSGGAMVGARRGRGRGGGRGGSSTQQPRPPSLPRGGLSFLRFFGRQESASSVASSTTSV